MANETVAAWQKRLEETFTYNGVVGGRCIPTIYELEQLCGQRYCRTYLGHICISDSFTDFFAATMNTVIQASGRGHWPNDAAQYPILVADFVAIFRTFRATTNLALNGYPLDAFALQRNLFEQALFHGAVKNGYVGYRDLWGANSASLPIQADEKLFNDWTKAKKKTERAVLRKMIGEDSGLGTENKEEIRKLFGLFHQQVHRSFLSMASLALAWKNDGKPPSVAPEFAEQDYAMFMNRHTEIAWMLLRCLPTLFHDNYKTPDKWKADFDVLDSSFRIMVESLAAMNKKIAKATIELIDSKFAFGADHCYRES